MASVAVSNDERIPTLRGTTMNTQTTTSGAAGKTFAMVSDFSEVAAVGLGAGLVFSLVASSLVVIVTTLN
jgi:hypothetical protein